MAVTLLHVMFATPLPWEPGFRFLVGEKVQISLLYAVGCLVTVIAMIGLIVKVRRDKKRQKARRGWTK